MAFTYQIDKERGAVLLQVEGTVVSGNLVAHQRELRDDPDFDPSYSMLADFTAVSSVEADSEAMHNLAGSDPFDRRARRAIVVDSDVVFGLARMYQMLLNLDEEYCRIFRDVDDARRWLGLD